MKLREIVSALAMAYRLYRAWRDYRSLRRLGFRALSALELAAVQAQVTIHDLFEYVKKRSGDFGDYSPRSFS